MNTLSGIVAVNAARKLSRSALPDAPTVPEREPTPRITDTLRAGVSRVRGTANRIKLRLER
jgi:hypothetical protein